MLYYLNTEYSTLREGPTGGMVHGVCMGRQSRASGEKSPKSMSFSMRKASVSGSISPASPILRSSSLHITCGGEHLSQSLNNHTCTLCQPNYSSCTLDRGTNCLNKLGHGVSCNLWLHMDNHVHQCIVHKQRKNTERTNINKTQTCTCTSTHTHYKCTVKVAQNNVYYTCMQSHSWNILYVDHVPTLEQKESLSPRRRCDR